MSRVYRVLARHTVDADNPDEAIRLIDDDNTVIMAVENDVDKWLVTPKGAVLNQTMIDGQWYRLVPS